MEKSEKNSRPSCKTIGSCADGSRVVTKVFDF